jgi:uncharacterized membrane protein
MSGLVIAVIIASLLGAGLVTGLLFAFSNCALSALADLPADKGMFAMQRVNERIINPIFLLLFFGTPILCAFIAVMALQAVQEPGRFFLLLGALAYLLGPFGVTVMFNVPLNNQLARTDPSDAGAFWPVYRKKWQRWNHVRTAIGAASIVLMALGLAGVQP